ncbi:unnamed protein product [Meganyctiphanes norvegica]|uniref:Uncharacterized protein n=1 Tax=Meganyctiphanes norvegica TaxID=48144 RepID=A0AAV2QB39_MEGNR
MSVLATRTNLSNPCLLYSAPAWHSIYVLRATYAAIFVSRRLRKQHLLVTFVHIISFHGWPSSSCGLGLSHRAAHVALSTYIECHVGSEYDKHGLLKFVFVANTDMSYVI